MNITNKRRIIFPAFGLFLIARALVFTIYLKSASHGMGTLLIDVCLVVYIAFLAVARWFPIIPTILILLYVLFEAIARLWRLNIFFNLNIAVGLALVIYPFATRQGGQRR